MRFLCLLKCTRKTIRHNLVRSCNGINLNPASIKQHSTSTKKSSVIIPQHSTMDIDANILKTAKAELLQIFDSSLCSVLPGTIIEQKVKIVNEDLVIDDNVYPITENLYLVGFGKAVAGMAFAMEKILGHRLKRGIISVPKFCLVADKSNKQMCALNQAREKQLQSLQQLMRSKVIEFCEGADDNQPDDSSLLATEQIVDLVKSLGEEDTLIVLVSGGGSALLFKPRPPLSADGKIKLCKRLQNAGASIVELNCVRKQLSNVKGGGLARLAFPASVISLILSDVVGDPLESIASGPTCPVTVCGESPQNEAIEILKNYKLYRGLDSDIKRLMTNLTKSVPAEEKHMVEDGKYKHVENIIIGNNRTALSAAKNATKHFDMESIILTSTAQGNVKKVSNAYAKFVRIACHVIEDEISTIEDFISEVFNQNLEVLNLTEEKLVEAFKTLTQLRKGKALLLLGGGEPTVVVEGNGKGGRNQELALTFSLDWLSQIEKDPVLARYFVLFLSAGTDGQDGPTDAAGAFSLPSFRPKMIKMRDDISEKIKTTAKLDKLDKCKCKLKQLEKYLPENVIKNNNSYDFYSRFDNGSYLVKTGLTGTNVMDIHFIYLKKRDCECEIETLFKHEFDLSEEQDFKFVFDYPETGAEKK